MATQKVDRFCHSCGELSDENDRFCVKFGDKRRSTVESEGGKGLKESKRRKSLDEYFKEKGKKRRDFFKPKFCKLLITRAKATKEHQIHLQ